MCFLVLCYANVFSFSGPLTIDHSPEHDPCSYIPQAASHKCLRYAGSSS
jgi:hypothetical protein